MLWLRTVAVVVTFFSWIVVLTPKDNFWAVPVMYLVSYMYTSNFGKITGKHSRPQFHLPPLGSLASSRHLVAKVGTSKRGGKQWQTTPKNVPRMQRTRSIPVDWLSSGLCPNRPKGWIPIIIIIIIIIIIDWSFDILMPSDYLRTTRFNIQKFHKVLT